MCLRRKLLFFKNENKFSLKKYLKKENKGTVASTSDIKPEELQ